MTNPTPHGQVPEALRLADLLLSLQTHMGPRRPSHPDDAHCWDGYTQSSAELRRLHAENEALRATHVQNPAEIEHVAGDVSKNGTESNMAQQPAPSAAAAVAIKAMGYGGSTGINDYLMSDGSVKAMRPSEVKWATQATPTPPAQAADSVLEDAERYRWLFGARTDAQTMSVSETVFKPLPQDEVLSHLQGFYMSKAVVDALVDAARKQGANHD